MKITKGWLTDHFVNFSYVPLEHLSTDMLKTGYIVLHIGSSCLRCCKVDTMTFQEMYVYVR